LGLLREASSCYAEEIIEMKFGFGFFVADLINRFNESKLKVFVLPAEAGIQLYQIVPAWLDSGLHRSDYLLRVHQIIYSKLCP
jgi:hypothetical protein